MFLPKFATNYCEATLRSYERGCESPRSGLKVLAAPIIPAEIMLCRRLTQVKSGIVLAASSGHLLLIDDRAV